MMAATRMSEKQFQDMIVDAATLNCWLVHHVRPGMTGRGAWLTNVQGHVGFPDLVLAHPGRIASSTRQGMLPTVVFAELKTDRGERSEAQDRWAFTLLACPGVEYYVWRPKHIDRILARLAGGSWQD